MIEGYIFSEALSFPVCIAECKGLMLTAFLLLPTVLYGVPVFVCMVKRRVCVSRGYLRDAQTGLPSPRSPPWRVSVPLGLSAVADIFFNVGVLSGLARPVGVRILLRSPRPPFLLLSLPFHLFASPSYSTFVLVSCSFASCAGCEGLATLFCSSPSWCMDCQPPGVWPKDFLAI